MKVYIALASSETQYVKGLRSAYELIRREGDAIYAPQEASYGSVTRTVQLEAFRGLTEYDAYLALDCDQKHPRDLLEKLRTRMETHDLDMVCAHYYRRQTEPIESLCYTLGDGTWPFQPYLDPPTSGLHEIGSTGQGCVLIHRRVIEAVWQSLLPGDNPFDILALPEVGGDHKKFGSDMGFFIRARRLGFRLWLDADAGESLHAITLWLGHGTAKQLQNYASWANDQQDLLKERLKVHGVNPVAVEHRLRILEARKKGLEIELDNEQRDQKRPQTIFELTVALHQMDGMLNECKYWHETLTQYPPVERPDQLPTTQSDPIEPAEQDLAAVRAAVSTENAAELVKELPRVSSNRNGVGHA